MSNLETFGAWKYRFLILQMRVNLNLFGYLFWAWPSWAVPGRAHPGLELARGHRPTATACATPVSHRWVPSDRNRAPPTCTAPCHLILCGHPSRTPISAPCLPSHVAQHRAPPGSDCRLMRPASPPRDSPSSGCRSPWGVLEAPRHRRLLPPPWVPHRRPATPATELGRWLLRKHRLDPSVLYDPRASFPDPVSTPLLPRLLRRAAPDHLHADSSHRPPSVFSFAITRAASTCWSYRTTSRPPNRSPRRCSPSAGPAAVEKPLRWAFNSTSAPNRFPAP
jgi:hypothetical protein